MENTLGLIRENKLKGKGGGNWVTNRDSFDDLPGSKGEWVK